MELPKRSEKDFFEEHGLEVKSGSVEVGETYPIFGMITRFVSDEPGNVIVEINFNIVARMNIPDAARINVLKERSFESGIFVSTVTAKEPSVEVECQTIVFGRRQGFNA